MEVCMCAVGGLTGKLESVTMPYNPFKIIIPHKMHPRGV